MLVRRLLAPALAAIALAAAAPTADAAAGAEVCAHRATLYARPGGAAVAVVRRGDIVQVVRRADAWWRVRTRFGSRGWVRAKLLCPEGP